MSSAALPIFLIALVDVLALTMLMPLMPFYAKTLGATPVQVGMMFGVYALCSLLAGPALGNLSDRHGRKPVLVVSQVGTLGGLILLAYAPNLAIAFLARMIDGVTAGNLTVAQSYLSDVTKPQDRTKSFAVIGIAFGIGFLIGPAATAYIASHWGERNAILAAGGLSALSIVATITLLPRKPPVPEVSEEDRSLETAVPARRVSVFDLAGYLEFLQRPNLAPLFWQFMCFALAFSLFMGGFAMFAERRFTWEGRPYSTREVGYMMAYSGFLGILVQGGILGRMIAIFSERTVLLVGYLSCVVSFAVMGLSFSMTGLAISLTALALSGVLRPVVASALSRRCGRHEQGVAIGLSQSLQSIAQIVGPFLAGILIEHNLLYSWAFLAAGIAAMGVFFLLRDSNTGNAQSQPPEQANSLSAVSSD